MSNPISKTAASKALTPLADAYARGWECNKAQQEFYATILNDLAEGIEVRARLTRINLAGCLGHMRRQNNDAIECIAEMRSKLLLMAAESFNLSDI